MNTNCLEGFSCPKCGFEDRFDIVASSVFTMTDDGEDSHGDVGWDGTSICICCNCNECGTVKDFRK